ncbi:MAG: FmdE family protein [Gracilibacteraceae bacterium]|nr:FmdE family protein [Gracilibacteraceae bacterium]
MQQELWEKACAFHGHICPGLALGARVCEAALEAGFKPSEDEELVCITENDACGVDAIQAVLGCTFGKGNLIYKGTGKHAYTFIQREQGRAERFYLRARKEGRNRADYLAYVLEAPLDELFVRKDVQVALPEKARIFVSVDCEICGEEAPEHKIRLQEGKKVCLDCYREYERGF